jgi:hypothetical protein
MVAHFVIDHIITILGEREFGFGSTVPIFIIYVDMRDWFRIRIITGKICKITGVFDSFGTREFYVDIWYNRGFGVGFGIGICGDFVEAVAKLVPSFGVIENFSDK